MRTGADQSASGLGALGAERFDAVSAVGGWRGVLESAVPILVFVVILAVAPTALTTALVASLTVSGVALLARLAQRGRRRNLKQVAGGALVTVLSAAWAWRSGQASNFYATGLVINAVCLLAFLGSLLLRRPLIGVLMELWHPTSGGDAESPESPEDMTSLEGEEEAIWRSAFAGDNADGADGADSPAVAETLEAVRSDVVGDEGRGDQQGESGGSSKNALHVVLSPDEPFVDVADVIDAVDGADEDAEDPEHPENEIPRRAWDDLPPLN